MRPRVGGCKAGNHDNDLELASIAEALVSDSMNSVVSQFER
jgi:hypothetical protein